MAPGGKQEEDGGGGGPDHGRPPPAPRRRRNWRRFLILVAVYSSCSAALFLARDVMANSPAIDPKLSYMLGLLLLMLIAAALSVGLQQMWSALARR